VQLGVLLHHLRSAGANARGAPPLAARGEQHDQDFEHYQEDFEHYQHFQHFEDFEHYGDDEHEFDSYQHHDDLSAIHPLRGDLLHVCERLHQAQLLLLLHAGGGLLCGAPLRLPVVVALLDQHDEDMDDDDFDDIDLYEDYQQQLDYDEHADSSMLLATCRSVRSLLPSMDDVETSGQYPGLPDDNYDDLVLVQVSGSGSFPGRITERAASCRNLRAVRSDGKKKEASHQAGSD
jgi:hypothetical protein